MSRWLDRAQRDQILQTLGFGPDPTELDDALLAAWTAAVGPHRDIEWCEHRRELEVVD